MRRPALLVLTVLVAGCAGPDLARRGGGVGFTADATPAEVYAEALALAAELGWPARERGGVVEVELAEPPMSERPSRWLRVTAEAEGTRTVVVVTALPTVGLAGPGRRSLRAPAYAFADALADRL